MRTAVLTQVAALNRSFTVYDHFTANASKLIEKYFLDLRKQS